MNTSINSAVSTASWRNPLPAAILGTVAPRWRACPSRRRAARAPRPWRRRAARRCRRARGAMARECERDRDGPGWCARRIDIGVDHDHDDPPEHRAGPHRAQGALVVLVGDARAAAEANTSANAASRIGSGGPTIERASGPSLAHRQLEDVAVVLAQTLARTPMRERDDVAADRNVVVIVQNPVRLRHRRGRTPRADRDLPTQRTPLQDRAARHRTRRRPRHHTPDRRVPPLDQSLSPSST